MSAEMSRREFAAALSLLPFTTLQIGAVAKWTPLAPAINKPDATFLAGLDRLMELAGVPGVGVGLVQESRMVWQHHAGVTELNAKPPVTVDTLFPAASLAKPVFAYAVLRLVDQGRLDLDRPLKSYVPNHTPADGRGDRITARHVLSHSSGYRNWRNRTDQPLTAQSYSRDFANRLLAVAESSGKPLARWTHDEIVAAMEKMTPAPPALPNFIIPNAAGSLLTTVADYSLFLGQLLTQSNTTVALKPETLRMMQSAQSRINGALSWGLGWGLEREHDRDYLWHWGDNGAWKNFVLVHPASRSAIVVFTSGASGLRVSERIIDAASGHQHAAFLWV